MGLKRATLVGTVTMLAVTATALAEPSRTVTLNRDKPTAEWEDGPTNSAGTEVANPAPMCSEGFPCDDTLVKVDVGGALTFTADGEGVGRPDMDIYLYTSDDKGTEGEQIAAGETPETDETLVADVEPGWYLARAAYFSGNNMTYKGTLKLEAPPAPPSGGGGGGGTPPPPPPSGGGGGSTPPPSSQPSSINRPPQALVAGLKRSVKRKSLKTFKGTASDDAGVAKVEIGLVQIKGKKCKQLTRSGSFKTLRSCKAPTTFLAAKGTNAWSFKLRKRLGKGRYVLFARATDNAGAVQPGLTRVNFRTK